MEKPNLSKMWETYIKLGLPQTITNKLLLDTIRLKLYPMLHNLKSENTIKWYCFLLHGSRKNGDPNLYFHIRIEPKDEIKDREQVISILPNYCEKEMTELSNNVEDVTSISGIDKPLLKNEEIEEAWRILGEQSEWLMDMLNIYKDEVIVPISNIMQFMHFFLNMLGQGGKAVLYAGGPIFQF
jgi:hypothetical protein